MAKNLLLMRPARVATAMATAVTGAMRVLSPDPKEAAFWNGGPGEITLDLGAPALIDTFFAGFTGSVLFDLTTSVDGSSFTNPLGPPLQSNSVSPDLFAPVNHAVVQATSPVTARYVRFFANAPANMPMGVAAVGLSVVTKWGHEWGAGRTIEDTGSADRLIGGGFGIEEGVRVGGYQWTFGDLTDSEIRKLYAFFRDRGTTRSFLLVEDPQVSDGLHERIHWGLAGRLDAYERTAPNATRWSLSIRDWA